MFVTAPLNFLNYLPENHGTIDYFLLQIIVQCIILERHIHRKIPKFARGILFRKYDLQFL